MRQIHSNPLSPDLFRIRISSSWKALCGLHTVVQELLSETIGVDLILRCRFPMAPSNPAGDSRRLSLLSSHLNGNDKPSIAAAPVNPESDDGERNLASIPTRPNTSPLKRARDDRNDTDDSEDDDDDDGSEVGDEQVLTKTPAKRRLLDTESLAGSPLMTSSPLAGPDLSRTHRVLDFERQRPVKCESPSPSPSPLPSTSPSHRAAGFPAGPPLPESRPDPPPSPFPVPKKESSSPALRPESDGSGDDEECSDEEEDSDEEDYEDYYKEEDYEDCYNEEDYYEDEYWWNYRAEEVSYHNTAGHDEKPKLEEIEALPQPSSLQHHPAYPRMVICCRRCYQSDTVEKVFTSWSNAHNPERPYFNCKTCCDDNGFGGFICWADTIGIDVIHGICCCGLPVRQDWRTRGEAVGTPFFVCSVGRCWYRR